jgi:C4-dicarboxylate transporter DctM subunit
MDVVTLSALIVITLMVVLLIAGVPIGVALGVAGMTGTIIITGSFNAGLSLGISQSKSFGLNFAFIVIPMFVLMGHLASEAGIIYDLFKAANRWVGHFSGGMAMTTLLTCTGMAALSGSSIATVGAMMPIALPEMRRYGYDDMMSVGTITSGGTLSIMIPPSMTMVVYAIFAQESIGKLLIAGILPGILIFVLYTAQVMIRVKINPRLGPRGEKYSFSDRISSLFSILPFMLILTLVLAGILFGVWTPVEASAAAVILVLGMALIRRRSTVQSLFSMAKEAAIVSSAIVVLVIGSFILGNYLAVSGVDQIVTKGVIGLELPRAAFFAILLVFLTILGMFLEIGCIMAITIPLILPILKVFGWSPIWFGVIMINLGEMAALTPPVGVALYVAQAAAPDINLSVIFKSTLPFWICNLAAAFILFVMPDIALFLPSFM